MLCVDEHNPCWYADELLLETTDSASTQAGRVGLWIRPTRSHGSTACAPSAAERHTVSHTALPRERDGVCDSVHEPIREQPRRELPE